MTFISLHVTDDGENGNGDWTLNFDVNGVGTSNVFPDDAIDDGQNLDYRIDKFVDVPIDQFTTGLTVRVTGLERDSFLNGADDPLTVAEKTFSPAENFGIGGVHTLLSGADGRQSGWLLRAPSSDRVSKSHDFSCIARHSAAGRWLATSRERDRKRVARNLPPLPDDDASSHGS